jgi:hypothetical protein
MPPGRRARGEAVYGRTGIGRLGRLRDGEQEIGTQIAPSDATGQQESPAFSGLSQIAGAGDTPTRDPIRIEEWWYLQGDHQRRPTRE